MRRFRGRAATDDEAPPPATGTSEAAGDGATETRPAGDRPVPANGTGDSATAVTSTDLSADATLPADATAVAQEPEVPGRDLPAGVDLDALRDAPAGSAGRGKLRRRVHYLRRVRELLLRDLGGFYVEAHRSAEGPDAHRHLLDAKASRLATLDAEVRELEERLSEPHAETVLREPGIGGSCPECGELFGADARFCSRCAHPLTGRAARERTVAPSPTTGAGTTGATTSGGITGAGAIGPATGAAAEEERLTTASLWGRRRSPAAAEPAEATRAADLTQPATDQGAADAQESTRAEGGPQGGADAPAGNPAGRERPVPPSASDPSAAGEPAAAERPGGEPPTGGRA